MKLRQKIKTWWANVNKRKVARNIAFGLVVTTLAVAGYLAGGLGILTVSDPGCSTPA
ncbi:MAG: hypothetical protein ACFFCS_18070 [Candidatus Hodarchaeota archaeon]